MPPRLLVERGGPRCATGRRVRVRVVPSTCENAPKKRAFEPTAAELRRIERARVDTDRTAAIGVARRVHGQNVTLSPSLKLKPAPPAAGLRYQYWNFHVELPVM